MLRFLLVTSLALLPATRIRAAAPPSSPYSTVAISNHLAELRRTAGPSFIVLWERPFAVAGDLAAANVRFVATNTVRWATTRLKAEYFPRDPSSIIDIWLFKDDASYRHHARSLFGDSPTTPFGYFSSQKKALVMNISTGTGTLVHEMVHAFMDSNFDECPAWFNEGLASLYEQCGEKAGRIYGYPNWRLPGLQKAIREGKIPTFKTLTASSSDEFYGRTTGAAYNEQYAQARYLCYHLQERGLLQKFFREFHGHAAEDPTGYASLQKVLGENDLTGFQARWSTEMLLLRQ